jgi:hypothetical protein
MFTPFEYCHQCRKIVIAIEMTTPVKQLCELPSTYDTKMKQYVWHYHELFAYLLIPRDIEGHVAHIDFIICIEEYDLRQIDLVGYASKFLHETLLPQFPFIKDISLTEPVFILPVPHGCHKHRYYGREIPV